MLSSSDEARDGQQFKPSARVWNAFVHNAMKPELRSGLYEFGSPTQPVVPISIHATSDIAPGAVVGFSTPKIQASDNDEALQNVIFDHTSPSEGRWAIAQSGIGNDEVAACSLVGVAWAQVNVTDATHTWADVDSG